MGEDVILGAALALPSYLSYEAFHSLTKHRFLCNLTEVIPTRLGASHELESSYDCEMRTVYASLLALKEMLLLLQSQILPEYPRS